MRRRLTLTGSTLRPRDVQFKTMVADELAKTVWPYVEGNRLKPVIDKIFPLARRQDRADDGSLAPFTKRFQNRVSTAWLGERWELHPAL